MTELDPTEYLYRIKIPCANTTVGAQTNYALELKIVKGNGVNVAGTIYLNNHALNWPDDIRFTTYNETTLLDFYREESDATDGTWWVELDSIEATGNTDFYMYYGDADAADASSGSDVFTIFYDGFEANDLNLWTAAGSWVTGAVCTEGSYGVTGAVDAGYLYKDIATLTNVAALFWVRKSTTDDYNNVMAWQDVGGTTNYILPCLLGSDGHFKYWAGESFATLPTDKTYAANTWYRVHYALDFCTSPPRIRWLHVAGTDGIGDAAMLDDDNGVPEHHDRFWMEGTADTGTTYVDQVCVRKYVYPEPAWATPQTEPEGYAYCLPCWTRRCWMSPEQRQTASPGSLTIY